MTAKKAKAAPKPKRGKPTNLYLHPADEDRLKDLGTFIHSKRGSVSKSQVIKAALIVAKPDDRLLEAFDVVKSRDLRFTK